MKVQQLEELILQSLEHEIGGVNVYRAALKCVKNDDLKKEWEKYLGQTQTHVTALEGVCEAMGLDTDEKTPGRAIVRHVGQGLVEAMEMALRAGNPTAAELVACECVVIAETKDHLDWELLAKCAKHLKGKGAEELRRACDTIEDEEDEHLYHSKGFCRELWLESLSLDAVLPPPEERKNVKTAIGAARAEQAAHKG